MKTFPMDGIAKFGIGLLMAATVAAIAQTGSVGVRASYSLLNRYISAREPVFLEVSIENGTAEGVTVDASFNNHGVGGFDGTVVGPDGIEKHFPVRQPDEVLVRERVHIPANDRHRTVLLLNKWLDLDQPGRYVLDIRTNTPYIADSGFKYGYPLEGRVEFEVSPRDALRLEAVCKALDVALSDSDSNGKAFFENASALALINDPVAVPFLARLWERSGRAFAPIAISALQRIGDSSALDVLISQVHASDADTRLIVGRALRDISSHSADLMVRQKIEDALR